MNIDFEKELNVIRYYAADSIEYGEASGNKIALRRGTEVDSALKKIETYIDYMKLVASEAQMIEDLNVRLMSDMMKRLDPDPF